METTDEAEPTITRPITQSNATTTARTVPVGSSATVATRPDDDHFLVVPPDRGTAPRPDAGSDRVAAVPEVGVTTLSPRAQKNGPTPDTSHQSCPRRAGSGGIS